MAQAQVKLAEASPRQAVKLEAEIERKETQFNVLIRSESPQAVKASGQGRRQVLNIEVVDKHAAFKGMPHCFDIVPKMAVLKACCIPADTATELKPETTLYAGIKCWWSKETTFRS